MGFSISDVLSIIQNGVTAVNNLSIQVKGSFNNILSRLDVLTAAVAAIVASVAAIAASYVVSLNSKTGAISFSVVKQVFIVNGTYTPTTGMVYCILEAVGPGGGGGGSSGFATIDGGGGGGGGSYSRLMASAATIGASQTVTIGAVGTAGAAANPGGNGGDTSVGTLCIGKGGTGGTAGTGTVAGNGGAGGVAGTGDFSARGGNGEKGCFASITTIQPWGGSGGESGFGFGTRTTNVASVTNGAAAGSGIIGATGSSYGGGGSGSVVFNHTSGNSGGAGGPGIVVITEFVIA